MTKTTERQEELVKQFLDAAIEVHRELGPGYDEAVYENALVVERISGGSLMNGKRSLRFSIKERVLARGE
ncbi:MAG: GxxExxY protein [Kiritimatiellales bacterium]|nr:GxxExxY protein [Kiritimatiellales bacterium]MCF7864096.1 GxxExxY protein [Kiritimatiellales bacterium]